MRPAACGERVRVREDQLLVQALLEMLVPEAGVEDGVAPAMYPGEHTLLARGRLPPERAVGPGVEERADPMPAIGAERQIAYPSLSERRHDAPAHARDVAEHGGTKRDTRLLGDRPRRLQSPKQGLARGQPGQDVGVQSVHVDPPAADAFQQGLPLRGGTGGEVGLDRPHALRVPHEARLLRERLAGLTEYQCFLEMGPLKAFHLVLHVGIANVEVRVMDQVQVEGRHGLDVEVRFVPLVVQLEGEGDRDRALDGRDYQLEAREPEVDQGLGDDSGGLHPEERAFSEIQGVDSDGLLESIRRPDDRRVAADPDARRDPGLEDHEPGPRSGVLPGH